MVLDKVRNGGVNVDILVLRPKFPKKKHDFLCNEYWE